MNRGIADTAVHTRGKKSRHGSAHQSTQPSMQQPSTLQRVHAQGTCLRACVADTRIGNTTQHHHSNWQTHAATQERQDAQDAQAQSQRPRRLDALIKTSASRCPNQDLGVLRPRCLDALFKTRASRTPVKTRDLDTRLHALGWGPDHARKHLPDRPRLRCVHPLLRILICARIAACAEGGRDRGREGGRAGGREGGWEGVRSG